MAPKVAAPGVFLQAPMVAGRPLVGAARFRPRAPREFRVVMQAVAVDTGIKKAVRPASLEEGELPMNTFKTKEPFVGEVVSVERIVGPNATGETCHVRIKTNGKIPFHEGQSYGVIPPGTKTNSRGKEVPHGVRLYTIASTRYGDDFDGQTASLCIRRATYKDPESGEEDAAKKGICSNFLCDAKKGMKVNMTGPSGKLLLLPEDKNAVLIMVATGTGIAPYRAFWRRAFLEDVSEYKFTGLQWLFMGCANNDAKLYDDEIQTCVENFPDQFRVDYALSREQKNKDGGKMYIQDKIEEYSDQIFDLLADGAHIYFCGLKGMMPGITEMLQRAAAARGLNFDDWLKNLKEAGTWHVEVY